MAEVSENALIKSSTHPLKILVFDQSIFDILEHAVLFK